MSRSDQSRKNTFKNAASNKASHGLPLPRSTSKKLAQTYRQEAQKSRKNKFEAELNAPESKNRNFIPRPIEQPKIINHNEQTFENVNKLVE